MHERVHEAQLLVLCQREHSTCACRCKGRSTGPASRDVKTAGNEWQMSAESHRDCGRQVPVPGMRSIVRRAITCDVEAKEGEGRHQPCAVAKAIDQQGKSEHNDGGRSRCQLRAACGATM